MSRRAVLIAALEATPRDLSRMLRRLDDGAATWRPGPETWDAKEIVSHLSMVETRMLARWRRVVTQDNPLEAAIKPPAGPAVATRPLADLLAEFERLRAETCAFLSALGQRDWGRPFDHATRGPSRLRDDVQAMVTHDNEHLSQLMALREALEAEATR